MSDLILSSRRMIALYFFDAMWVLGFMFLSYAIPFMTAVQHTNYPDWPAWDKTMLHLGCSISAITTVMALFKQIGKRLRSGKDILDDSDQLPQLPPQTTNP